MTQIDELSVRQLAKLSGLPPATVHRFRTGQNVSLETAAKMRPFVENCPCCGISAEADRKARATQEGE
ncbi:helix-turn-helix domain-containing protein [uncultured Roseobacter sp.]|uniref:helix-turn-helix domain-containing protein n=1 Tax=uncultured Roseobacter sp. TaxID=114847 RepID=UPI00345036D5